MKQCQGEAGDVSIEALPGLSCVSVANASTTPYNVLVTQDMPARTNTKMMLAHQPGSWTLRAVRTEASMASMGKAARDTALARSEAVAGRPPFTKAITEESKVSTATAAQANGSITGRAIATTAGVFLRGTTSE